MVASKAWEWDKVKDERWRDPAAECYYLAERWGKQGYKNLLDLGCGVGRHAIFFARRGFTVEAFDLSEEGLAELKEGCRGLPVNTTSGEMKNLPYEDSSFDCVLAYHVIYHTDTAGIKQVISEIKRVLKLGGEFYITFISKNHSSFQKGTEKPDPNTVIKMEEPEVGIPHYYAGTDDIGELLEDFTLLRVNHVNDLTNGPGKWHFYVLGSKSV